MNVNFKKLATREDWEQTLRDIIEFAGKVVRARNDDGISEANELLNKYIETSPPEKWWTTELDDHAREALGQLMVDVVSATNDELAGRTGELRRIAKSVSGVAAENDEVAAGIRHEKLTKALVSALDTAKAVKELQSAVKENAGDEKVVKAAVDLLDSIAAFKDTLAAADAGG